MKNKENKNTQQQRRNNNKQKILEKCSNYDEIFSYKNLYETFNKCKNNVSWKRSVQQYKMNLSKNTYILYKQLKECRYKSKGFIEFDIYERGKPRHIKSVNFSERIVQKVLCEKSLIPLLERSIINTNSASQKGKGTDFAIKKLDEHIRNHIKKHGLEGYILQFDFSSYFENINHEKVFEILDNIYEDKDNKVCKLAKYFVSNFGIKGLGLGSQISQILAISYGNRLDHFIKEKLQIKGYGRYMDDGYLIHESKEYLQYCLKEINKILEEYGITLNKKKTHIVKLSHGFTFLKIRYNITSTGKIIKKINKKNVVMMRRKLKKFKIFVDEGKMTLDDVKTSYNSWLGSAKRTNSYKTIQSMNKLFNELFCT